MSTFFADYPVTGGVTSLNGLTGALTIVGAGGITVMASGSTITLTGSGGSVTSVGLSDSTGLFNITGSPVTTSGTLTLASFQSQAQDTFFAAPQGSSGAPTFRLISIGDLSFAGQANGVATLDSSGKVPASELPSTVLEYQGLWDPSTNTPLLTDLTGTNGYVYQVSTAFPGPIIGLNSSTMVNFQVGNLVIYSSAAGEWQQADALTGVTSVNGAVGAVTVNAINQLTGDITAGPASGSQSQVASLVATSNSTLTTLSSLSLPFTQTTGTVPINRGGTGQVTASAAFNALSPVTSTGDLIIGNGTNSATRLAIGSSTQVLTVSGGTAVWAPAPATGVTSVALADGSTTPIFAITGSPVTSSGTLTETLVTQSANAIFAGPTTGVAAQPAFRGLVSADIPNNAANTTGTASNITASSNSTLTTLSALSLPGSQVTGNISGNAANITATSNSTLTTLSALSLPTSQLSGSISLTTQVSGVLPIANGGTDNGSLGVTAGGVIYTDGTMFQNVGVGTSGQVLTSQAAAAPIWQSPNPAGNSAVRSVTGTDSATTADNVLILSGASFTETLFTAVGNTGHVLQIIHNGISVTNIYTLSTTASQTIGGVASGSYLLNTNGEVLTIVSDGANWQILDHKTNTAFSTAFTYTYNSFGTVTNNNVYSRRVGDSLQVYGFVTAGTTTTSTFQINLPTGIVIDSTKFPASVSMQIGTLVEITSSSGTYPQTGNGPWPLYYNGSTTNALFGTRASASNTVFTAAEGSQLLATGTSASYNFTIPVTGWQP